MTASYPPEPWHLRGSGQLTIWRLPCSHLPRLPDSTRALSLADKGFAVTAFVDYEATGLLAYRELLAGVVVRNRRRVGLSITDIWVDSPSSKQGGRELWGIPKEMAAFPTTSRAEVGHLIAEISRFRPRTRRSVRLPFTLSTRVIQTLDVETVQSRMAARGRIRPARASWRFNPDGPLAWLAEARELTSVAADEFTMTFGPRL